jgi:hypothetical protein
LGQVYILPLSLILSTFLHTLLKSHCCHFNVTY